MDEKWFTRQADDAGYLTRMAERAQETFWGLLGCEVARTESSKAAISLDILPMHLNLLGIVHGGVLMSLMDNAMGLVVMLNTANERTVTANMNTHFLASGQDGQLLCEAELIHRTARTMTLLSQVKDEEGRLLAWGSGTYRLL